MTTTAIQEALDAANQAGAKLADALTTAQDDENNHRHHLELAVRRRVNAEEELKAAQVWEKKCQDDVNNACTRRRDHQEKIAHFTTQIDKMNQIAAEIKSAAAKG